MKNRGMIATEDIIEGDLIVYVPREMFLSPFEAQESPTAQTLREKNTMKGLKSNINIVKLTLFIMEERRNPNSRFRDFIGMLPTDMSSFPLFYSNEDFEWLEGTDLIRNIEKQEDTLNKDYSAIASSVVGFSEVFSYREFQETYTHVSSRTFHLRGWEAFDD